MKDQLANMQATMDIMVASMGRTFEAVTRRTEELGAQLAGAAAPVDDAQAVQDAQELADATRDMAKMRLTDAMQAAESFASVPPIVASAALPALELVTAAEKSLSRFQDAEEEAFAETGEEYAALVLNGAAYASGGGAASQAPPDNRPIDNNSAVSDRTLRYLGHFVDRVCMAMGQEDNRGAMDWSDPHFRSRQWFTDFKSMEGIGASRSETISRAQARKRIKRDFEKAVLERLGSVRFAVISALFWIQNRQGHSNVHLWDIIHSETWAVWFLDLVSLLHRVNGLDVRTAWQIKELKARYQELADWFDDTRDFGEPPLLPRGQLAYTFQSRVPFARVGPIISVDAQHIADIRLMVIQATGDIDLTTEQTEHLVHTVMTKYFPTDALGTILRVTHSKIVFTQLLAMQHSLSVTFYANRRNKKRIGNKALPTAHMTAFLTSHINMRIKWLMNFRVHGCACVQ